MNSVSSLWWNLILPSSFSLIQVTVRGPAADVDKAVSYLTALAQDKEIDIYEDTVVAQANYHK